MSRKSDAADKNADAGKNRGWPKGKRRYPKGAGAPKQPLSGYVHFLNERRETVRAENPDITFSDLSKKLAAEWSALAEAEKNKYNEQAKRDKDRYDKEFADYQHTDSYKQYLEVESLRDSKVAAGGGSSKKKKKAPSSPASSSKRPSLDESDQEAVGAEPPHLTAGLANCTGFDIPIFTEEFLDHNKARELELKQLRKQTSEFEEQNAVLGKHIDSMKSAISKLEVETVQQRQSNAGLQQQLDMLRQMVLSSFRGVTLPGSVEPITPGTVDQFVSKLHGLTENSNQSTGQQALLSTVRDIVSRMDFSKIPA